MRQESLIKTKKWTPMRSKSAQIKRRPKMKPYLQLNVSDVRPKKQLSMSTSQNRPKMIRYREPKAHLKAAHLPTAHRSEKDVSLQAALEVQSRRRRVRSHSRPLKTPQHQF